MAKRLIKSAEELDEQTEDQFELDESVVDEVSNAEEFADVEISNEDIMDAVEAIDALADAVIEKADAEEKEIDADALLDQVRDMIDDSHEEEPEEEEMEEAELPEEIESSVVRVMVSEDGAIDLEQKPDEVYDSTIDGLECTMFDTTDNLPMDIEETADVDNTEDDVLVIGNSASKKFKKGYLKIKSSANKKAWSNAYKKVKKMVGSSKKLTAAHWAIVAALAKKEEEEDKLKKKIECRLIRAIRSNKDVKDKFFKYIKSNFEEFDSEGAPESETKPDTTAEPANNGYAEEGDPTNAKSPEEVESQVGDPVEDPSKQVEGTTEDIVLPDEAIVVVDVPLTNSTRKVRLQKVRSSKTRKYNMYKVIGNAAKLSVLDGKVIKSGKVAYAFKNTAHGIIVCCAAYVNNGKGTYKPIIKNNKVVISRGGNAAPVFQNYEKILFAREIISARREGYKEGLKRRVTSGRRPNRPSIQSRKDSILAKRRESILNARKEALAGKPTRRPVKSSRTMARPTVNPVRTPVKSNRMTAERREVIRSRIEARKANMNAQKAINSKVELQKMHEAEERQRLFQSSQTKMNEEKIAIKSSNTRNADTLNKMYKDMF